LFGLSPFTLRLPALLGAIGYLVAAAFFARLLAPTSPLRAGLIFIALGLNPWIFDYLPAARGYSMALAGEMTAIFLLSRLVFLSPGQGDEPGRISSLRPQQAWAWRLTMPSCSRSSAYSSLILSGFFAQRGLRDATLAAWQLA
jgi:hypothetical protein